MSATDTRSDVAEMLEVRLQELERAWRAADHELGRLRLVDQVRRVPPPLVDLLRRGEVGVAAIGLLRSWRYRQQFGSERSVWTGAANSGERSKFAYSCGYEASSWFQASTGARIGLGLRGVWLDVSIELAPNVRLHTRGARGFLRIERTLPHTVLIALVGEPVEALVAHPLLFGSGMVVTGFRVGRAGTVSLAVDTGCVEVDLERDFGLSPGTFAAASCRSVDPALIATFLAHSPDLVFSAYLGRGA